MKPIKAILEKMLVYSEKALFFVQGITEQEFYANDEKQYAVCLALLQIGEMVALLSDEHRKNHPDVPWKKVKGLRNIIAHQYSTIDETLLWQLVSNDLPELTDSLRKQVAELKQD